MPWSDSLCSFQRWWPLRYHHNFFRFQVLLEVAANRVLHICAVRSAIAVALLGEDDQIVGFTRADECLDHLHRLGEEGSKVAGAVDEEQLPFEVSGQSEIGAVFISLLVVVR